MERTIIRKLRESSEVSLGTYKGYSVTLDRDNTVLVKKQGNRVASFENEEEAYAYIDNLSHRSFTPTSTSRYCIKVLFSTRDSWYYLCKDGHYKKVSYVNKNNIRLFDAKNKAEQALKYSTRTLNCLDKRVELFK